MTRLTTLLCATIVACASSAGAAMADPMKPRQLVTQYSCAKASAIEASLKDAAALSLDARVEVEIVFARCAAEAHNKAMPDQPLRAVLVAPSPYAPSTTAKINVAAVSLGDAQAVRDFCQVAGADDIVTDAGRADCASWVGKARSSLIVLAPAQIGGGGVTTRLLTMMVDGATERALRAESGRLGDVAPGSIKASAQEISDHPLVLVEAGGKAPALNGGTGGEFLHATKCLGTMGFGRGC